MRNYQKLFDKYNQIFNEWYSMVLEANQKVEEMKENGNIEEAQKMEEIIEKEVMKPYTTTLEYLIFEMEYARIPMVHLIEEMELNPETGEVEETGVLIGVYSKVSKAVNMGNDLVVEDPETTVLRLRTVFLDKCAIGEEYQPFNRQLYRKDEWERLKKQFLTW